MRRETLGRGDDPLTYIQYRARGAILRLVDFAHHGPAKSCVRKVKTRTTRCCRTVPAVVYCTTAIEKPPTQFCTHTHTYVYLGHVADYIVINVKLTFYITAKIYYRVEGPKSLKIAQKAGCFLI
jgi:hypothetical protein